MLYKIKLCQSEQEFGQVEIDPSDIRTLYTYRIRGYEVKSVNKRLCIPSKYLKRIGNFSGPHEYLIVKKKKDNTLEFGWGAYRCYEFDCYRSGGVILSFSEDINKALTIYANYLEMLSKAYHDDYLKVMANISQKNPCL